ncbi:fructose 1,6-bisphosphatase [uncultured Winogradskyella sp.]|uniref:fructose 1,6-bisphosphatase n=1 Tax=uncultured Winogradskyella sp. TaxID=395353 RepID=UPI0026218826|nr:fructose 1,6-bisphosphatase [uncultured Winogradskyella sp.]
MKTKINGAQKPVTKDDESSKFEAIKEILFGENIKTYNHEFESVKKDILNQRQEILDLIADTQKEIDSAIDNLSTDLNIRITELQDQLNNNIDELEAKKVSKATLSDLFIKLGTALNS